LEGAVIQRALINFGDCFAYALARITGEPLLFKGNDFSKTTLPPRYLISTRSQMAYERPRRTIVSAFETTSQTGSRGSQGIFPGRRYRISCTAAKGRNPSATGGSPGGTWPLWTCLVAAPATGLQTAHFLQRCLRRPRTRPGLPPDVVWGDDNGSRLVHRDKSLWRKSVRDRSGPIFFT
jgi:hypothetical protein